jgi:hypothetical protein
MVDDPHLPWSAPDVAKAVRESAAALTHILKVVRYTADLYDHSKARRAAGNLDKLLFAPGMRKHLEQIADGKGSDEDIKALGRILDNTARTVLTSLRHLINYRSRFRENHGLGVTLSAFDDAIDGPVGKAGVRRLILELVWSTEEIPPNSEQVQQTAQTIMASIEVFHKRLIDLHDLILPPKRGRPPIRRRAK